MLEIKQETKERFDSLLSESWQIISKSRIRVAHNKWLSIGNDSNPLDERVVKWKISALHLIEKTLGENSTHYKEFFKIFDKLEERSIFYQAIEILKAAKDDYEKGFHVIEKQEAVVTNVETKSNELETIFAKDAKRNARIYLGVTSLIFIFICSALFYFFGIGFASIITFGLLIICYFLSSLSLKEWTPTKLPERVLELEKNRIYKKFGVDIDKD